MKELSIKEKAEAYDKALEIARQYWNDRAMPIGTNFKLERMFPELKESEDERIRKAIVKMMSDIDGGSPFEKYGIIKKEALAWLEKQGEQKPVISNDALREGITHFGITQYQIDNWLKKYVDVEKQGKQKLPIEKLPFEMKTPEESLGVDSDTYSKIVNECIYDEQKPTDKVEPKFKQGDWIVFNGLVLRVGGVSGGFYVTTSKDGITNGYDWSIDNVARLWTIQDAKDGDILCTYECDEPKIVFILKGVPKIHYALSYHCYYNIMYSHFDSDSEKGCLAPNDEDVKPATEEQRDLLFSKMEKAGYEWDSETKKIINNND